MNKFLRALLTLVTFLVAAPLFAADDGDITGTWEVVTTYNGGLPSRAGLEITRDGDKYSGKSGWLIPDYGTYEYTGTREKDAVRLTVTYPGGSPAGELLLRARRGTLTGSGNLGGVPVSITGHRPRTRPPNAPRVHDFTPTVFYRMISGALPPALRIFPGDTVRTETVDAAGTDKNDKRHQLGGNAVTGPFYVEGAMPGDTLAVHFNRIRPNRKWAFQQRAVIHAVALPPGAPQSFDKDWSDRWTLDLEKGTATPDAPSERLKNVSIRLEPMLGVVSVAPFWDQVTTPSELGRWGGNLDYNQVREGVMIYFTVYQAGAFLFIGDGHARQGDGEITGQGLEISMDVDFTVDVIKGPYLDQPWLENDEYVMVCGISGSLDSALQKATGGLSRWLAQRHHLNDAEIATLLANSIRYDIAEVVDGNINIVAKIGKDVLAQLPQGR
jgi:amidase